MGTRTPWIIWFAIALHAIWGVALLQFGPQHTTAVDALLTLNPTRFVGLGLIVVAGLATWSLLRHRSDLKGLFLALPQQFILLVSAAGAGNAILNGHYADGVPRPHVFILIDQIPIVLTAALHTAALIDIFLFHADSRSG